MSPCQRVASIRERLSRGEIVVYQLDIVAGVIDLRQVRYEFPSGPAVITLAADLVSGRLDRASIGRLRLRRPLGLMTAAPADVGMREALRV
jgi:hypothetical protein